MRVFKSTYRDRRTGEAKETNKWYVELRDHRRIIRRMPAFTDKSQSGAFGRTLLKLVENRMSGEPLTVELSRWLENQSDATKATLARWGLIDQAKLTGSKTLAGHIADWVESMRAKGVTRARVRVAAYRLNRAAAKAAYWTQLTPELLRVFLKELLETENASALTHNGYVQLIRQFCQWMIREGRATQSPAISLPLLNAKSDRRHVRRAFTLDQMRTLLSAAIAGPERYGMTGNERAAMYRLAAETGLRAGEIRALTRQCFKLDETPPVIELGAEFTKNRQYAVLELRPDTAAMLKAFLADKLPLALAFNMPPKWNIIDILKADLEAAGILYADDMGRVLDFHSFRHTCGAWLAASGAHPKVIQSIMRHSTITLTMDTYGHRLMEQESEALAKLPDLSVPPESQSLQATGTHDMPTEAMARPESADVDKTKKAWRSAWRSRTDIPYTSIDLDRQNGAGMMQTQSPMESTQSVDFTGGDTSRAAVAQLVERSFRKA